MVTVKPVLVEDAVTVVATGGPGLTRTLLVGAGDGVMSCEEAVSAAVMVAVPATVPICTPTELTGASAPAGMVRVTVRPPVANWTVGSSGPESATKVRVRVTVTSSGYGLVIPICSDDCVAGLVVAGKPVRVTGGVAGSATVKLIVTLAVAAALSFTVTTDATGPGVVGLPESWPPPEILTPAGRPEAEKVYGGVPPLAPNVPDTGAPTVWFEIPGGGMITSGVTAIVTVNDLVAVVPLESVTVTPTVNVPAVVGVPPSDPLADAVTPGGSPVNEKVYGPTPPLAPAAPL